MCGTSKQRTINILAVYRLWSWSVFIVSSTKLILWSIMPRNIWQQSIKYIDFQISLILKETDVWTNLNRPTDQRSEHWIREKAPDLRFLCWSDACDVVINVVVSVRTRLHSNDTFLVMIPVNPISQSYDWGDGICVFTVVWTISNTGGRELVYTCD